MKAIAVVTMTFLPATFISVSFLQSVIILMLSLKGSLDSFWHEFLRLSV